MSINHHTNKSFQPSKQCDSVLIAGNGPSLAHIDYDLLPENIDIFRCNQFYMEDQYFVGKKIKAAFFISQHFMEQQATMAVLNQNQEYQCEHIVYSELESSLLHPELSQGIFRFFPNTINAFALYREKLPELAQHTLNFSLLENEWATSGVIMAITAVAMGYKKLYIAGVDFYTGSDNYAFDSKKDNLKKLNQGFAAEETMKPQGIHSMETDLFILHMLQGLYDVKIYCVSPSSPLMEYFSSAPKTGLGQQNHEKYALPKSANALKDIVIPDSYLYDAWRQQYSPNTPKPKPKLKNNLVYRLIFDLLHLPSHIRSYLRAKNMR